jgi:hypothetical protein
MPLNGWRRELCAPTQLLLLRNFLYDHILTQFGCPLTSVTNQGTHFINDVICYLINHFILRYTKFIIYYP